MLNKGNPIYINELLRFRMMYKFSCKENCNNYVTYTDSLFIEETEQRIFYKFGSALQESIAEVIR